MAQLTQSVLGRVSGKLGDITFRQRNGKNIIGVNPRSYPPPEDQGSVDRRARFAFSAKLAQAIGSVPELNALWLPVTPQGMSTFNFIIQKNILLGNPGSVSDLTMITPPPGFTISCTSSSVAADAITAALGAIGTLSGIVLSDEPTVKLAYLLSLTNPASVTLPEYRFIGGTSDAAATVLDSAMQFTIPLVGLDSVLVESYQEKKLLIALVTFDEAGNPVKHSGTLVLNGAGA